MVLEINILHSTVINYGNTCDNFKLETEELDTVVPYHLISSC